MCGAELFLLLLTFFLFLYMYINPNFCGHLSPPPAAPPQASRPPPWRRWAGHRHGEEAQTPVASTTPTRVWMNCGWDVFNFYSSVILYSSFYIRSASAALFLLSFFFFWCFFSTIFPPVRMEKLDVPWSCLLKSLFKMAEWMLYVCFTPQPFPPCALQDIYELKDQIQDVEGRYMQGLKELKVEGLELKACLLLPLWENTNLFLHLPLPHVGFSQSIPLLHGLPSLPHFGPLCFLLAPPAVCWESCVQAVAATDWLLSFSISLLSRTANFLSDEESRLTAWKPACSW